MPAKKKPILIDTYDYVEYADGGYRRREDKLVIAIYGIDDDTLNKLDSGTTIKWDVRNKRFFGETDSTKWKSQIWNGEVYAVFQDFVIVYLY